MSDIASCAKCSAPFRPARPSQKYCSKVCSHVANTRHGLALTTEYAAWKHMRNRCNNPKCRDYPKYGGRGITIAERWEAFENFLADMGPKPSKQHSIERVDNDAGYGPDNCKWGTKKEQSRNRSCCWTPEEHSRLADLLARGLTFAQIGSALGRNPSTVGSHARRAGLRSMSPVAVRRMQQLSSTELPNG